MPLPVIPGGFRARSSFTNVAGGRPWSTGMDFFVQTGVGDEQELADAVRSAWLSFFTIAVPTFTVMQNFFRSEVNLVEVEVYNLGTTAAPAVAVPTVATGGVASGVALPPDIAAVVSKRTAFRGARGRGRSYIGGLASTTMSLTDQGLFAQAFTNSLAAAWITYFAQFTLSGVTYQQSVIGRIAEGSPLQAAYPITAYIVDQNPDVQRRRGLG